MRKSSKKTKGEVMMLKATKQSLLSKSKEYEILRTEILQYMEEYQTVRNMMYVVTGTVLAFAFASKEEYYLFLLPLVAILPCYIIFYNYVSCVSVASIYMQVFLEDGEEKTESANSDLYRWEGRHRSFSEIYENKCLKNSIISHAQHLPYYVCALICLCSLPSMPGQLIRVSMEQRSFGLLMLLFSYFFLHYAWSSSKFTTMLI